MDGKVGMVNPPTFMYIKTFEDTRKFILENTHINLFVEWGYLGMFASFARVDSAMFILEMHSNEKNSTFIKLNDLYEMKRKAVLFEAYDDYLNNRPNNRVYTLPQSKLKGIKSYPFIYWISDEFREKFGGMTIESKLANCQGLITSNNNRFLRYWWEVKDIGTRWYKYAKGGPFNKWYGNDWVVILWGNNGNLLKAFVDENGNHKATIRNEELQLSKGITFCKAGSKGASFRLLEHNHTFDSMSPCVFDSNSLYYTIGIVNSMLCRYILGCLNPTAGLQAGDIARVPYVLVNSTIRQIIRVSS